MTSGKWRTLPKRHVVKKRQAFKVESISEQETKLIYGRYYSSTNPNKRKHSCRICGNKSVYKAYFQMDGCQLVERYCESCLDKYVIYPYPVELVNK